MKKYLLFFALFTTVISKAQLYVANGETITVATSGDLNLQEDLNNNGTITNLTLGGSGAITGTGSIGTLVVNTTGTFTASSGMQTITSLLTPTAGTLIAGGFITLQSNNGGTAYGTSGAATITGLNIQHYLTTNQRGWRLVGSPFTTDVTLASLATASNIDITYGGDNGYNGTSAPSSETYNPSLNSWTGLTSGSVWAANSSMALFIRGTTRQGIGTDLSYAAESGTPSFVTLQAKGTLNAVAKNYTLTPNAINIIANPFAAPISLYAVMNANTSGYASLVTYYNPTLSNGGILTTKAGGYFTPAQPTANADIIIPPMGSFVITSNGGSSFTIPTSAIASSTAPTTGVLGMENNTLSLNISGADNKVYYDALTFRFDPLAKGSTGDTYDFLKMANENLDLYSISTDNKYIAYDNRNLATTEQIIPLGLRTLVQQNYTINAINNATVNALLRDKLLKTETDLTGGNSYSFAVTADTATQGINRFEIVLNAKSAVAPVVDNSASISVYPNPASDYILVNLPNNQGAYHISVTDLSSKTIETKTAETGGLISIPVKQYATGYYIVTVRNAGSVVSKKIFKN